MRKYSLGILTLLTMAMICLLFAGCSNDRIIITNADSTVESLSEIQKMFPATEGYKIVYKVEQSNGASEIVTYTVGDEVTFGYGTAHEMHVRSTSGESYTNYFVFSASALYFYEGWSDDAEKVLSLPLTVGATWNKNDLVDVIETDTNEADDSTNTGNIKGDEGDPNDPKPGEEGNNGANKNFPGNNAGTFTIEATETLSLSYGDLYGGTIRVRNDNGSDITNYYWFAPRVGLVRWVLNADPNNISEGSEVGELVQ